MKNDLMLLLAILFIQINAFAQNIKTPQDTAILEKCAKIPESDAQFNLSYPSKAFDLKYKIPAKDTSSNSLEKLLAKLEKNPKDVESAMFIVDKYKAMYDYKNYNLYLEYAYNHAYSAYKEHPDSFLIVRQFCHVLQKANNIEGMLGLLKEYVEKHPKNVDALADYAIYLCFMAGNPTEAWKLVEQAYKIEPDNYLVYSAAMTCEMAALLLNMGEVMAIEDMQKMNEGLQALKVNDAFFQKVIQSKSPSAAVAQMALDASQLYIILYRSVFAFSDKKFGEEKITILLSEQDKKVMEEVEKRCLKQLKNKKQNVYFAYKTLCVIEALRGNASKVVDYWTKSGDYLKEDADVLNWIFWAYMLSMDYNNGIVYLEKKIAITNSYDDAYTLGRVLVFKKETDKAIEQFKKTQKIYLADKRATCAIASVLFKDKKYDKALETVDYYPSEVSDDIKDFHINYFKALVILATGDKADAIKRLEAIDEESPYKKEANKLLEHFREK